MSMPADQQPLNGLGREAGAVGDEPDPCPFGLGVFHELHGLGVEHGLAAPRQPDPGPVGPALIGDDLEGVLPHEGAVFIFLADGGIGVRAVGAAGVADIDKRKHAHHGEIRRFRADAVTRFGVVILGHRFSCKVRSFSGRPVPAQERAGPRCQSARRAGTRPICPRSPGSGRPPPASPGRSGRWPGSGPTDAAGAGL